MKKIIDESQINAVLQTVYQTDIPAKTLDALKKFFQDLPEIKPEEKVEKPVIPVEKKK